MNISHQKMGVDGVGVKKICVFYVVYVFVVFCCVLLCLFCCVCAFVFFYVFVICLCFSMFYLTPAPSTPISRGGRKMYQLFVKVRILINLATT